jgi:hypothetical protein
MREFRQFLWAFLPFALLCMAGCVSSGKFVSSSGKQQGYRTLARFDRPGQAVPAVLEYSLVETPEGKGLLEWDIRSRKGFVAYFGWRDEKGDHYIAWVDFLGRDALAVEYVVPDDSRRPILVYHYEAGTYTVVESKGVRKPVPQGRRAPVFKLLRNGDTSAAAGANAE